MTLSPDRTTTPTTTTALQWAPLIRPNYRTLLTTHGKCISSTPSTQNRITDYFRYVGDILLIFDPELTDIQFIITDFKTLHPNLHFTAENERDNIINYLDISIQKKCNRFDLLSYREIDVITSNACTVLPITHVIASRNDTMTVTSCVTVRE